MTRISRVHGTTRPIDPASGARAATGYAMYHPAAALRQAALRETMQRDMAAIPETLMRARDGRATLPEAVVAATEPARAPCHRRIIQQCAAAGATITAASDSRAIAPAITSIMPTSTAESTTDMNATIPDDQLGLF